MTGGLTNTYTTFPSIGNREELSNVIYNISPEETPFISNAGRGRADAVYTEWQQDSLAAVNLANAQVQGDDLQLNNSFDAVTPTVRLGNYTQISRKSVVIADTEERINKAGRDSEIAYQVAKKGAELKRDLEGILLQANTQYGTAGSSTTAATTAPLLSWIKTNTTIGAGGANPVYTSSPTVNTAVRTDGTQAAFTETMLKTVLAAAWTSGGNPKTLMVDGTQKQTVSGFAGLSTKTFYQTEAVTTSIIGAADVYVSDFGTIAIVPNRFQRHRDAWVLDWEYLELAYLRPFKVVELAKTGDAEKRMLIVEYVLKVLQQAAMGGCFDLT